MTEFEEAVMQDIEQWADTNLSKEYLEKLGGVASRIFLIEKYWAEYLEDPQ